MTDEWSDPVAAHKMKYRNMLFDSKLELAWFITLEGLGCDIWDHPAQLRLEDGTIYEPDFLVGEVLCEVKGGHDERLWKPYAAHRQHGLPVLVLRQGVVPPDWETEVAGCDWESCDEQEWVIALDPAGAKFMLQQDAEMIYPRSHVRFAARTVLLDPDKLGLPMRHWSEATHEDV